MPKNARCAVGYCNNDKRYPEYFVQRSHIEKLLFRKWPKNEHLAGIWLKQLKQGRSDEFNPAPGNGRNVCLFKPFSSWKMNT